MQYGGGYQIAGPGHVPLKAPWDTGNRNDMDLEGRTSEMTTQVMEDMTE